MEAVDAATVSSVSSSGAERGDNNEVGDAKRETTMRSAAQERDMATRSAAQERGTVTSSPTVAASSFPVSSPEWVYLLALVLSSLIPLHPFLPCHCRNPTCPRRFFPSFGFSPSSSALGSVAAVLQACSDLGMAARVGGEEWGRFGNSSREGTTRAFFFGREEPGP
uniref:Uncharacterized protein n=1 Tax=Oryza meridionalis TaxID=40149 RepID=A0A0E0DRD0_9ORYZ